MATINSLAAEFNAQPHEVAAFGDLGDLAHDAELNADTETMIREAWAAAPEPDFIDAVTENRREDAVLDEVAEVVDRALLKSEFVW